MTTPDPHSVLVQLALGLDGSIGVTPKRTARSIRPAKDHEAAVRQPQLALAWGEADRLETSAEAPMSKDETPPMIGDVGDRHPVEEAGDAMPLPSPPPVIAFGRWLLAQAGSNRKDAIGRLAVAARASSAFPRNGSTDDVRNLLNSGGADEEAFDVLDLAEKEFLARAA